MLIEGMTYVRNDDQILCSTSACLAMLFEYYGISHNPLEVADAFNEVFLSSGFHAWYTHSLDIDKYEESAMLSAAQYFINGEVSYMSAGIISTEVSRIRMSYIKRKMPVLVTGRFPLLSGSIANTVIVRGYVDDYLIVNDPKGNANSGYVDRYGENVVYSLDDFRTWTSDEEGAVHVLRVIERE